MYTIYIYITEPLSEVALRQLVATLQTALLNPAYRTTVSMEKYSKIKL